MALSCLVKTLDEDAVDETPQPSQDCDASARSGDQVKSPLDYLQEIHRRHDKYVELTTGLELASAKEFGGTVTEFHPLKACLTAALEELCKIFVTSLV
jgi:hypothetical protein